MDVNSRLVLTKTLLLSIPLFYGPFAYAAQPVNLSHKTFTVLHEFQFVETKTHIDFNKTLHIRAQQTYENYPVWGGEFVVHIPKGAEKGKSLSNIAKIQNKLNISMNGILYQDINIDLANTPATVFSQANAQKGLQQVIDDFMQTVNGKIEIKDQEIKLIVFIDKENKAHWAYKVSFYATAASENQAPAKPVSIIDAISGKVYAHWDDVKNLEQVGVDGGGFGGNIKMGKLIYDGLQENLAKLDILRDAAKQTCFLKNSDVTVKDYSSKKIMTFSCKNTDDNHNNVYWDADFDAVNNGYSPGNDALFGGQVIKHMYQDWYGIPVLTNPDGTPMVLTMIVHQRYYDNAYWDGSKMTFGDGYTMFYPLTSLGVAAHEISHGFTEQHSDLNYYGQSGGMNEAFSDMAAQAAEFYAYGKNSWQIGPEIFKEVGKALRYMDQPSKDCNGKKPGNWCSIDDAGQYTDYLDVHYSSGVYNHFFYFLGTSQGWDPKKAFDVMVHANSSYWTPNATFSLAACGVLNATKDLGFEEDAVKKAFEAVKVDYTQC